MGQSASKKEIAQQVADNQHVIDNPGQVGNCYDVNEDAIGQGSFATVHKVINKSTRFDRAIKVTSKRVPKDVLDVYAEIHQMKVLDHPNIIMYFESFEDKRFVYIVMQLCEGPSIFDLLNKIKQFSESQTAVVMQQLFRAVTYMHSKNIVHRDLKTENLLFYLEGGELEDNTIKIIDFGHAITCKVDKVTDKVTGEVRNVVEMCTQRAGTPFFVAPQVLAGCYDNMCDVWSLGVIMYSMIAGYPPFTGESDSTILAKVRLGNYVFNDEDFKDCTQLGKDVIKGLMKINPTERMDTASALHTPWMQKFVPHSDELPLKRTLVDLLRSFGKMNGLKQAAFYAIATCLTDDELKASVESFNTLDVEGDGNLGNEEICSGLRRAGIYDTPADLPQVLEAMDSDGSGQIEFTEFLAATIEHKYVTEQNVWSAFRVFDQNGDGKISQTELYNVLNRGKAKDEHGKTVNAVSRAEVIHLMSEISMDGTPFVSFREFFTMMKQHQSRHHQKNEERLKELQGRQTVVQFALEEDQPGPPESREAGESNPQMFFKTLPTAGHV